MSRSQNTQAHQPPAHPMAHEKTLRFLGEFAEKYRTRLIKRLQRAGETKHEAEELVDEVIARLVREFISEESPPSEQRCVRWVSTTLTNLYTDVLRKRRTQRKALPKLRLASDVVLGPDEPHSSREDVHQREQIAQALRELSPTSRATLDLYADGLSGREIARLQEIEEGTVRKRIHDGKRKIIAWFKRFRTPGGH